MGKMKATISSLIFVLLCSVSGCAQQDMNANHNHNSPSPAAAAGDANETQDWAKQRLAKSPRHQEWVKVKNGTREVNSFVVYPEVKTKRPRWS